MRRRRLGLIAAAAAGLALTDSANSAKRNSNRR